MVRIKTNPAIDISDELVRACMLTENSSLRHHIANLYKSLVERMNNEGIRVVIVVDGADKLQNGAKVSTTASHRVQKKQQQQLGPS